MIIEEGRGYRLESRDDGVTLVATDFWSDAADLVLESGRADALDLNYALGFKDTGLAFIRPWPLKRLSILARTVKDLGPVQRLSSTLESLNVQAAPAATIDLTGLPLLTSLGASWGQVRSSIAAAPQLQDLFLLSYNEVDLAPLRWNIALKRLRFKDRPSLQSLAGVETLQDLEHLAVYLAPLQDLEALRNVHSALDELHIESCRVRDLDPIAHLRTLRVLNASECGDIESLRPLAKLVDLEVVLLFGTTRVVDDDLSPLAGLPRLSELRMRSRRTYRPPLDQIQSLIADRAER